MEILQMAWKRPRHTAAVDVAAWQGNLTHLMGKLKHADTCEQVDAVVMELASFHGVTLEIMPRRYAIKTGNAINLAMQKYEGLLP